ncbi:MAG: acyl-CoA dehydrogenase family protein [Acidimicrobiaceae bacterium]|nr:acyl-CoA dehydrogenase family protein [Acidimicrobiaceae bacterium]
MSLDFSMPLEWQQLRARARAVAQAGAAHYGRCSDSWINGHSREFSRVLAAEGFIGMTWPRAHGGAGRPGIERVIMAEEMISAGAPVAACWFADRQMGPSIYSYGTQAQKDEFLPSMLSGEASWCIGMSEPDAGSDLASLKTSARRDGDQYIVNGQKIWTSGAADADYCYAICRTGGDGPPHRGLSELIVPMSLDGIEVRQVRDMVASTHFCEIFFSDVRVPVRNLVGAEGAAFAQTMVQLGFERGGIDRLVSNRPLYDLALEHADLSDPSTRQQVAAIETGYRLGRLMVYRGAMGVGSGSGSADYSAGTKAFCTEHQQRVAQFAARVLGPAACVGETVPAAVCYAPAYTIQGGTSIIMRNIIAERILGLPREPR